MLLTTVTRRSIIDIAGVLDTPLKLVTKRSFKRNNRKIKSKPQKSSKTIFLGGGNFPEGHFSGGEFFGAKFSWGSAYFWGVIFWGAIFSEALFWGAFFSGAFFRTPDFRFTFH